MQPRPGKYRQENRQSPESETCKEENTAEQGIRKTRSGFKKS